MCLCQGWFLRLVLDALTLLTSNWPAQGDYFQSTWGSSRQINSLDRIASQVPEISTLSSLLHPTSPELREGLHREQTHKSTPLLHWLMRDGGEKYNKLFDPWPFAHCIALAFLQQRLTRWSSCKRASIFQRIIFSVLEGKGGLHSSAALWRGQVPPACTSVYIFSSSDGSSSPELTAGPRFWSCWACHTAGHWGLQITS